MDTIHYHTRWIVLATSALLLVATQIEAAAVSSYKSSDTGRFQGSLPQNQFPISRESASTIPPIASTSTSNHLLTATPATFLLAFVVVNALFGRKRAKSEAVTNGTNRNGTNGYATDRSTPPKEPSPPPTVPSEPIPVRARTQSMSTGWKSFTRVLSPRTTTPKISERDESASLSSTDDEFTTPPTLNIRPSIRRSLSSLTSPKSPTSSSTPPLPTNASTNVLSWKKRDEKGKSVMTDATPLEEPDIVDLNSRPSVKIIYGPPPRYTGGSSQSKPPVPLNTICKAIASHTPQESDELHLRKGEFVVIERGWEDGWVQVVITDPLVKTRGKLLSELPETPDDILLFSPPSPPALTIPDPIPPPPPSKKKWKLTSPSSPNISTPSTFSSSPQPALSKKELAKQAKAAVQRDALLALQASSRGTVPFSILQPATEEDIKERSRNVVEMAVKNNRTMAKSPLEGAMQGGMFAAKAF